MAVAFDAASESHTGTSGSTNQASFTFTHTPVGSPTGVLVFTFVNANADDVTAVSWGGLTLTAVSGGRAVDTGGEAGDCKAWFFGGLTSELSARTDDTVTVTRANNANAVYAVAITVTTGASSRAEVHGTPTLFSTDGTCAEESITDDSPGQNSVRFAGINSGLSGIVSNPGTPGANNLSHGASSTWLHSIDFGTRVIGVVRETTAGQGSRSVGFSASTSDDRAAVHLAVKEVAVTILTRVETGALSFTSAGSRTPKSALTAALSFTSAQAKKVTDFFAAGLSFTSAQLRKASKPVTAVLDFATAFTGQKTSLTQALEAGLSFVGSVAIPTVSKGLTASLSFTSAGVRGVYSALSGALSFATSFGPKLPVAFTAALSLAGASARKVPSALAAALSFTGAAPSTALKGGPITSVIPHDHEDISWNDSGGAGGTLSYPTGTGCPDGSNKVLRCHKTTDGILARESFLDWYTTNYREKGSLAFWFKGTTSQTGTVGADFVTVDGDSFNFRIRMNASSEIILSTIVVGGGGEVNHGVIGSVADLSQWHFFEVSWDITSDTSKKVWVSVDGNRLTEVVRTTSSVYTDAGYFYFGPLSLVTGNTGDYYYGAAFSFFNVPYALWHNQLKVRRWDVSSDITTNWATTGANRWSVLSESPPDSTTYISSSAVSATEELGLTRAGGWTLDSAKERCIGVTAWFQGASIGADTWSAFRIRDNGVDGPESYTLTGHFTDTAPVAALRPSTSTPWTDASLGDLRMLVYKSELATVGRVSGLYTYAAIEQIAPHTRAETATLSFAGAQSKRLFHALAATLAFTSAKTLRAKNELTATLSFTTAFVERLASIGQALAATLSFTSAQTKRASAERTATLSFTSAQARTATKPLTAALSFAGDSVRKPLRAISAALSFTTAQTKRVFQSATAALDFAGGVSGFLLSGGIQQAFSATLSFTTTQTRFVSRALTGALTFTGDRAAKVPQSLAAGLSFAGAVLRSIRFGVSGELGFSVGNSAVVRTALTGALSFAGASARVGKKALTGALSFSGAHTPWRLYTQAIAATLSFTGASTSRMAVLFSAALSFVGRGPLPPRGFAAFLGGQNRSTDAPVTGSGTRGSAGSAGPGSGRSS